MWVITVKVYTTSQIPVWLRAFGHVRMCVCVCACVKQDCKYTSIGVDVQMFGTVGRRVKQTAIISGWE